MRTILFFHQSAQLYGSDKTILQLAIGMLEKGNKVLVVLPEEGPLSAELQNYNIRIIISPVFKLSRDMFFFRKFFYSFIHAFKSVRKIKRELNGIKIDCVHSNTLAVLLGAIYAKIFRIKHLWHVHEIIQHPKIIISIYKFLLKNLSSIIIYNSHATALHWGINSKKIITQVIHNGVTYLNPQIATNEHESFRNQIAKISNQKIVIALLGRISRLKGQRLLLKAFENCCLNHNNCILLFVGDPPKGQEFYQTELESLIEQSPKKDSIKIIPFQKNISEIYELSTIIVIPSTEPESFGMIALEAMIAKKPVVAAGHGGILELIEHNKTGLIFEPNNEIALSQELKRLIEDKSLTDTLVTAAFEKAQYEFPLSKYINSFESVYTKYC